MVELKETINYDEPLRFSTDELEIYRKASFQSRNHDDLEVVVNGNITKRDLNFRIKTQGNRYLFPIKYEWDHKPQLNKASRSKTPLRVHATFTRLNDKSKQYHLVLIEIVK